MKNMNSGDIAIFVGVDNGNLKFGDRVTLEKLITPGEIIILDLDNPPTKIMSLEFAWSVNLNEEIFVVPDIELIPLRGDFAPERQKSQEVSV